jgi:hypothetical protein
VQASSVRLVRARKGCFLSAHLKSSRNLQVHRASVVGGKTTFMAPYKRTLFWQHGWDIAAVALVLFVNLFGLFYGLARLVFLKNTGVKLHHLDRQLSTRDAVLFGLTGRTDDNR